MRSIGTCPFCGLLCGGVSFPSPPHTTQPTSLRANPAKLESTQAGASDAVTCERQVRGWELAQPNSSWHLKPLRHGRNVEARTAIQEASALLIQTRRTLFCGLATDVAGMRQVIDLARLVGGVLDHLHSDALQLNLKLLQHGGWIATTLSEIRFRADVIVLVGDSLLERFPRLLSLLVHDSQPAKQIYWLGTDDIRFRTQAMLVPEVQSISIKKSDWMMALTGLLREVSHPPRQKTDGESLGSETSAKMEILHTALTKSRYATWVWTAADFLSAGDELILDVLVRLVTKLNETSRSAVLPLAGSHGDVTAQQVCTWKTGFPLRQALNQNESDYQPNRYSSQDVLRNRDCDAAIYVSAFEPLEPPEEFWGVTGPKIIVGHPALKAALRADYFFPCAIPGIDHESHLFRGDGVAVVSVDQKRDLQLPAVAEWLGQLKDQYSQQRSSESSEAM